MAVRARGAKAKCWTFVYKCFPDDVMERLEQRSEDFEYLIASKVNNEGEAQSLRGYIIFKCQKRMNSVETILNIEGRPERLEIEIARGSSRKHKAQCKCGQGFFEIGENKFKEREKSQLEMMRERRMQEATEDAMLEEFGDTWIHSQSSVDKSIKRQQNEESKERILDKFQNALLRPWQEEVLRLLRCQGPRRITFVVDETGNTGKTFLAKYILATKSSLYFTSTTLKDTAYAWNGERYIVFDVSREKSAKINYSTLETIKNGIVFSSKYKSSTKIFPIPIIVCMMNTRPYAKMMSNDRYHIVVLDKSPDPLEHHISFKIEDFRYAQERVSE
eukprot:gene4141-20325_t